MSNSPAITRSATTMPAVCDGEAKKTASAARTSNAPVVSWAYREALFDGVSRPSRCGAAGLCRWLLDQVMRPSRRSTLVAEGRSTRSYRSRNANLSGSVQSPLRIHLGLLYSQPCRLPDEAFLLRVGSRPLKSHRFIRPEIRSGICNMQSAPTKILRLSTSRNTPSEVMRCTTPRTGTNSARGSCATVFVRSIPDVIVQSRGSPNPGFPR